MQMSLLALLVTLALAGLPTLANAQESWLEVVQFKGGYGVFMREGRRTDHSDWVALAPDSIARAMLLTESGKTDQIGQLSSDARSVMLFELENKTLSSGSYIFSIDKVPEKRVWTPTYFTLFLTENILSDIIQARINSQKDPTTPVKTILSKHYKTIIQVGNRLTSNTAQPIGQDLEIVPVVSLKTNLRAQLADFQILFQGKPMSGKNVIVVSRKLNEGKPRAIQTDEHGQILLTLTEKGTWILHVAHVQHAESSGYDWRIYQSTLTFNTQ